MNEVFKSQLRVSMENEVLVQAIRTVFRDAIDNEKPKVGEENDEVIGQKYRAYTEANKMIDKAFIKMTSYKELTPKKDNFDKAK